MNKINLVGRLTKDPDTTFTKGKEPLTICKFTLAVQRAYDRELADFIRVVTFGKAAEIADNYFRKGMRVGVSGRLQTGSYENKDGDTVYTTDVVAEEIEFCDSKKDDDSSGRRGRR